ncbi:MAG: hypothetical protein JO019_04585 [Candidatus Kaiserbacteria bacterium]|nr:hypothetical protein [Candidatus Kaiserbacteria bacterium]
MLKGSEREDHARCYNAHTAFQILAAIAYVAMSSLHVESETFLRNMLIVGIIFAVCGIIVIFRRRFTDGVIVIASGTSCVAATLVSVSSGETNGVVWAIAIILPLLNAMLLHDAAEVDEDRWTEGHSPWIARLIVIGPWVPLAIALAETAGLKWSFAAFAFVLQHLFYRFVVSTWNEPVPIRY